MALKTTAQTKKDVDEMSKADRLWDSLSYSYGQQIDKSNKAYDKSISQQDRALLGRGMQRSSYGMNTLSGLQNQKINAANDIESQKIADYENRLYQLEKDEDEKAYRDKAFEEQVRQYNEGMQFQKDEAARAQGNADREFEANRADTSWNQAYQQAAFDYQKEQDAFQNALAQSQFDFSKASTEMQYYYNFVVAAAANGKDVSDDLLAKVGISREDYNAMKTAAKSGGGGGTPKKTTEEPQDNVDVAGLESLLAGGTIAAGNIFSTALSNVAANGASDIMSAFVNNSDLLNKKGSTGGNGGTNGKLKTKAKE